MDSGFLCFFLILKKAPSPDHLPCASLLMLGWRWSGKKRQSCREAEAELHLSPDVWENLFSR